MRLFGPMIGQLANNGAMVNRCYFLIRWFLITNSHIFTYKHFLGLQNIAFVVHLNKVGHIQRIFDPMLNNLSLCSEFVS